MYFVSEMCFTRFFFLVVIFVNEGITTNSTNETSQTTESSNIQRITRLSVNQNLNETTLNNTAVNKTTDCILSKARDLNNMTQNQFVKLLTSECRYDRYNKPSTPSNEPLNITVRMDVRHIELLDHLQFRIDALLQYRYVDHRLRFDEIAPKRGAVLGRDIVKDKIWTPHLVIAHEKDVKVMGLAGQDVFVFISPQGEVSYAFRTSILVYCWMNLRKFPFDKQVCRVNFQSWTYNASAVMLFWEEDDPVKVSPQLYLTEFILEQYWINKTIFPLPITTGVFSGKYSGLEFKFKVARETGYYLMDYFIPSIMLVGTSWITFWLRADNGAPRTTLGTATMLSFITLASAQTKNLPKVSYIKISEIWFLGCALFICASMVEFAFVNLIWRRKKSVEMKKVNGKYILKGTLTPGLVRKEFYESYLSDTGIDCSNCIEDDQISVATRHNQDQKTADSISQCARNSIVSEINPNNNSWTTMTPHEMANWIDKRSRVVFPIGFLIFNICFWTYVLSVTATE